MKPCALTSSRDSPPPRRLPALAIHRVVSASYVISFGTTPTRSFLPQSPRARRPRQNLIHSANGSYGCASKTSPSTTSVRHCARPELTSAPPPSPSFSHRRSFHACLSVLV